jgi:hypothetical protein
MWTGSRINLDDIAIAAPCKAVWSEMSGDERERVCAECKLSVFNLSELSRTEAEDLLSQSKPGGFCIKLFRRADGTILTKDCPTGLRLVAKAKEFERLNNPNLALDYYEAALALIRRDGQEYDPKYVELVVSTYAKYLRKNKRSDDANKIERQLKAKTLYPVTTKEERKGVPVPDTDSRSLMSF